MLKLFIRFLKKFTPKNKIVNATVVIGIPAIFAITHPELLSSLFHTTSSTENKINIAGKDITQVSNSNSIHNDNSVHSTNQKGGITAQKVYIKNTNTKRTLFLKKTEHVSNGSEQILRIIIGQTKGIWNAGEEIKVTLELTNSYAEAKILQGFGQQIQNLYISTDKAKGFYEFSTTTAPRDNEPIILEFISTNNIKISKIDLMPNGQK